MISLNVLRDFDGLETLRRKKTMKKMMGVVLLSLLIIIFAGCNSSDDENSVTTTTTTTTTSTTTTTVPANEPATAVSVSMTPNNEGTTVPAGIFCTHTPSITGTIEVNDADGDSVIEYVWTDNDNVRKTDTLTLSEANGTTTLILPGTFGYHHIIKFTVTVDGIVSNSVSQQITCGANY
jgi:hypothetical protein